MSRRHLLSAVIAVAALAAGIALGAGPFDEHDDSPARGRLTATTQSSATSLDRRFVADAGANLTRRTLRGQRIAILRFPGADESTASALARRLRAAGGELTGTVTVSASALDPARSAYVDALTDRLQGSLRGTVNPELDTYPRFGQLLGAAYATTGATGFTDGQRTAAKTLLAGGLVTVTGGRRPATLVVALLGGRTDGTDGNASLVGVVHGLGGVSHGVVAAAPSGSVSLAAVRAEHWGDWFASVDGVETSVGRLATVLATARQVDRQGGNFGASGFGRLLGPEIG
ncbi:MAG: copper transporter [Nocardioides sp.]|uniref:copper transporter n=1 Tax=Nocardioides sp. TaxID=35761 RepID=UPI0039E28404